MFMINSFHEQSDTVYNFFFGKIKLISMKMVKWVQNINLPFVGEEEKLIISVYVRINPADDHSLSNSEVLCLPQMTFTAVSCGVHGLHIMNHYIHHNIHLTI